MSQFAVCDMESTQCTPFLTWYHYIIKEYENQGLDP